MNHHLIKHEDKSILISGYSRNTYKQYITQDIICIIMAFFDASISWTIQTKNFLSNEYPHLVGDPVIINGVTFKPHVSFSTTSNYILFKTLIASFESNANKCRYRLRTNCLTTNSAFISLLQETSINQVFSIILCTYKPYTFYINSVIYNHKNSCNKETK